MMVSPHPAQAAAKPCVSRAGQRRNFPRDLDDMHLQPADRTRTCEPVMLVRLCCPCRRTHTWLAPRSFAISLCTGSASFPVTNDPLEVSPFARRTVLQSLSAPLRNGPRFFQYPLPNHPVSVPCGRACLLSKAKGWVYHVSLKQRGMI